MKKQTTPIKKQTKATPPLASEPVEAYVTRSRLEDTNPSGPAPTPAELMKKLGLTNSGLTGLDTQFLDLLVQLIDSEPDSAFRKRVNRLARMKLKGKRLTIYSCLGFLRESGIFPMIDLEDLKALANALPDAQKAKVVEAIKV